MTLKKRTIKKSELKKILDFSTEIALQAGELLKRHQKNLSRLVVDYKDAQGVVSKADRESEQLVIKAIKKHFKGDEVLAEESSFVLHGGKREAYEHYKNAPRAWLIDPLDGTTNFLSGLDYYGVAIAFCSYGEPLVGVVYRPRSGELFYAIKGEGAYKFDPQDGKKRKISNQKLNKKHLKDSLFLTGFTSEKGVVFEQEFAEFKKIMHSTRAVRRFGSAALDLCYVAEGVVDGFWERGLAPWDVAAAGLIAIESHGKISDYKGQPFTPFQDTILCARAPLYGEILSKLLPTK